jgi:hypothetical protein
MHFLILLQQQRGKKRKNMENVQNVQLYIKAITANQCNFVEILIFQSELTKNISAGSIFTGHNFNIINY